MSRNAHTLHLHLGTARAAATRARLIEAIVAFAGAQGFSPISRSAGADRVIRVSTLREGWVSLHDDGYEIGALGERLSKVMKATALEACCEASAIVWLSLRDAGRELGGWGTGGRPPPARVVNPLLKEGKAKGFAEAFAQGLRQTFPETALAVAAQRFGLDPALVIADALPRGTTLSFRRIKQVVAPVYAGGQPSFEGGFGSNQGFGPFHLVFVDRAVELRALMRATGGPGEGLWIRFTGPAVEAGLLGLARVTAHFDDGSEAREMALVEGRFELPALALNAGIANLDALPQSSSREMDKVRALRYRSTLVVDVEARSRAEGEGALTMILGSGEAELGRCDLPLKVMFQPYRPRGAEGADDWALFGMHRREQVFATLILKGSAAEAWRWAELVLRARALASGEACFVRLSLDDEAVLQEQLEPPLDAQAAWRGIADRLAGAPSAWAVLSGSFFHFGNLCSRPWHPVAGEEPVIGLSLFARVGRDEAAQIAELRALVDEAMRAGVALSALVGSTQYPVRGGETPWEGVTTSERTPLVYRSWHEERIRGLEHDGVWLGATQRARIDLSRLPDYVERERVGEALRLSMSRTRPRRDFAAVEEALAEVLSSRSAVDEWMARPRG
jgi:hypothetical protein